MKLKTKATELKFLIPKKHYSYLTSVCDPYKVNVRETIEILKEKSKVRKNKMARLTLDSINVLVGE